jgi:hypothetical protein
MAIKKFIQNFTYKINKNTFFNKRNDKIVVDIIIIK